ncbi:synaptosomal-associated protein 47 [Platysternon megacephalum]|uniref:Synaptosomal-associated protein 47 n=1 Tax=Platysternon megacephalum TaxID=55544 RepID=A0A4D9EGJ5_9SAUR|nr:synaptosomal-associated protein 47 [Platysternon megacephalum]
MCRSRRRFWSPGCALESRSWHAIQQQLLPVKRKVGEGGASATIQAKISRDNSWVIDTSPLAETELGFFTTQYAQCLSAWGVTLDLDPFNVRFTTGEGGPNNLSLPLLNATPLYLLMQLVDRAGF